jgi:hypothetical protein
MKILILTLNVGRTAPGIVFERLIQGLIPKHEIDIITADYDPTIDLSGLKNIKILKKSYIHPRIYKLLISLFGINPFDIYWARKSMKYLKSKHNFKYDLIVSFISFHNYAALIAGAKLSKKYNCKFAVYSVDAIPAPKGWPENYGYFKGVKRLVAKYLKKADAFFSANKQMLDYQLSTFQPSKKIVSDVIYIPSLGSKKEFPISKANSNNFVYTGGIYGARKVKYLLEGFEKLVKDYPDSYLIFVGARLNSDSFLNLDKKIVDRIKVYPFTKNLDSYYSNATALIDIDADIENDVFLSSKIVNYIMINRVIISETGINSPSRKIFKNIESIIQCNHDSDQLYEAMKKSIKIRKDITFEDRNSVMKLFSVEHIVNRLENSLNKLF